MFNLFNFKCIDIPVFLIKLKNAAPQFYTTTMIRKILAIS